MHPLPNLSRQLRNSRRAKLQPVSREPISGGRRALGGSMSSENLPRPWTRTPAAIAPGIPPSKPPASPTTRATEIQLWHTTDQSSLDPCVLLELNGPESHQLQIRAVRTVPRCDLGYEPHATFYNSLDNIDTHFWKDCRPHLLSGVFCSVLCSMPDSFRSL